MMVDGFPVCDECLEDFTGRGSPPWMAEPAIGRACMRAGTADGSFQERRPRQAAGGDGYEPRWVHARDDEYIPL